MRGEVIDNGDIHSFETIDLNIDSTCYLGRDKNNVYFFGEVITDFSYIEGLDEYIKENPLKFATKN